MGNLMQRTAGKTLQRREFLAAAGPTMLLTLALTARGLRRASAQDRASGPNSLEERVANSVEAYDAQGNHRTGTSADNNSAEWLADEIRRSGADPSLEPFTLSRIDPVSCHLRIAGRRIEGVPMFDAGFTGEEGIHGTIGALGGDADIGLVETDAFKLDEPRRQAGGTIADARRSRHKGIIIIAQGTRPGLSLLNAVFFKAPSGPPMLQVSSAEHQWLKTQVEAGAKATLVAHVKRTSAQAFNVTARVAGSDSRLAPLVVVTPRSGWWQCTSERGGGLACWLETIRAVAAAKPARECLFAAFSGHELGVLGADAYFESNPDLIRHCYACIFLGANIGAPRQPNLIQVSDTALEVWIRGALDKEGVTVDQISPAEAAKRGEAVLFQRGGARYVVLACGSEVFHSPADRWPEAIDTAILARYAASIAKGTADLARHV
jgi:hypothetical protein